MPKTKTTNTNTENKKNTEGKLYCLNCGCANQNNFYSARDTFRKYFKKI